MHDNSFKINFFFFYLLGQLLMPNKKLLPNIKPKNGEQKTPTYKAVHKRAGNGHLKAILLIPSFGLHPDIEISPLDAGSLSLYIERGS